MKRVGLHIKDGKITTDDGKEMVLVYVDVLERLQEQLNEANEVIKKYATGTTQIKAKKYEGSCYITDPFTGEQKIIEDWGEEYDADVPMSNDDKPAKKYLKKWGVK